MVKPTIHLLLVEDSPEDARILQEALAGEPAATFQVTHVTRLADALGHLLAKPADLVLLDLLLPDSGGLATLTRIRERAPRVPIVILTASDDEALALQALQLGAQDYLVKGYLQVYHTLLGRSIRYAIERQRGEDALRAAQARTERLLTSITSIIIGVDAQDRVTHWNTVAEATFGVPAAQVLQQPFAACGIRWDTAGILQAAAACRERDIPKRLDDLCFTRPDGTDGFLGLTLIPLKETSGSAGFLIFGADVTERRRTEAERLRLQEELIQAQKLETIGRFAGGIAHDFQNFLQVILGFAWLIRARHREDRELISDLQEIVHAAESASGMVRQLLAFSRRQPLQLKVFDLNRAVQGMSRMVQQLVGDAVRVDLALAPGVQRVRLDPTGCEQMLLNLSTNARDAMPQGGALMIRTDSVTVDAAFRRTCPWARDGRYIRLSVQDTGAGMDPEVAAHIFEPFYTTKDVGKGTGLGMAVVYGLVKQHEGFVDLQTAPGEGCTFHLYFPEAPADLELELDPLTRPGGTERILVVEPDERVRTYVEEVLRESGYAVTVFATPGPAVDALLRGAQRAQALVLDASVDGVQALLDQLVAIRPTLRILLMSSGMPEQLRALAATRGIPMLQKPFVPAQLLDGMRQLLDQIPASRARGRRPRVLIVDDEPSVLAFCRRLLEERFDVTSVTSGPMALEALRAQPFDLLLTDLTMPDMDGAVLIGEALKTQPDLPVVIMTGSLTEEMEARLRTQGLRCDILRKPFGASTLEGAVIRHL